MGHCDLDLIFGDIRNFITEDILESYDKVFVHGHLTLYRNIDRVNHYFLLTATREVSFNEVIRTEESMHFDELGIVNILN